MNAMSSSDGPVHFLLLTFRLQGQLATLLAAECRSFELTPNEAVALLSLVAGPSTVAGIGRAAGIRPNGASVLVDRLRTRRLVRRERHRDDQRVVTVTLTDRGGQVASSIAARLVPQLSSVLEPLNNERALLTLLLERLANP